MMTIMSNRELTVLWLTIAILILMLGFISFAPVRLRQETDYLKTRAEHHKYTQRLAELEKDQ